MIVLGVIGSFVAWWFIENVFQFVAFSKRMDKAAKETKEKFKRK
jgi:hypothetical protein